MQGSTDIQHTAQVVHIGQSQLRLALISQLLYVKNYLDSAVVDQDIVHLEVSILAGFIRVIAQEGVTQAVPCLLVPDDIAGGDVAKAPKNGL